MKRLAKRLIAVAVVLVAILGVQVATVAPAEGASTCEQLRADITAAVNSSGSYGSTVPNLCTTDCPSLYAFYSNFPEVTYRDALAARLMSLWAACNVSKVPPTGLPSTGTTETPSHVTIKCPKINKDMHGRKDFAGTTCLAGKVLAGFNLSGMDLTGASLRSTNLTSANLTGAKLTRADLSRASLDYAKTQGTDFNGATLTDLRAAHIDGTPSQLPYNWKLVKGFLFGPHVDLSRAYLRGATLDNVDLSYANLTNTNLERAKLSNVNLNQAKFTPTLDATLTSGLKGRPATYGVLIVNGYLFAEGVNLAGANLSYANLSNKTIKGIDLSKANLYGATLNGTKFVDVTFKGAKLDNASLDRAVFDKCDLSGSSIQRAKATNASFASANLERADLSYSNLTGANLLNAKLSSVRVFNTELSKVRMDGWYVSNSYLKKN
jgi:uncharacterized protein YjbI with pentapeptide repeats